MLALLSDQGFSLDGGSAVQLDAAGAPISHALLNSARVLPPLALLTLLGWLNAVVLQRYWGRACKLRLYLLELCFSMAAWCGVCLACIDPGYVPAQAQPLESCEGSCCTVCNSFKPYRCVTLSILLQTVLLYCSIKLQ
jgi:hypothetical protein